jgi:uncharacterized protein (TIRG00374 family)
MAEKARFSENTRRWLLYAGLIGLAVALIANFGEISQLGKLLRQARWYLLPLVIGIQAVSYLANAKYYQSFLGILGYKISLRRMYEAALAINFVNQAFPSGGISGASFLARELSGDVPAGKATLTQVWRYVFTGLGFLVILVVGFLALFLGSSDSRLSLRIILLLILGLIGAAVVVMALVGDRRRMENLGFAVIKLINGIGRRLTRKRKRLIGREQVEHFFDEFYQGYHLLMQRKGRWWTPLKWAIVANFAEVATVYAVFLAFAAPVNPGIVITGYALANILGLLAFATGGVGVFEAAMIGTFVTLGVPFPLSFSATVTYRLLSFVLFLPPGFHYYRKKV